MTRPKSMQGGKPGRRTRQEEIDAYLQSLDLPPEVVSAIRQADPRVQAIPAGEPGSFSEMRDLGGPMLWEYFKTAANGVAKVQAYRAITELAKLEEGGDDPDEKEPLIADIVAGVTSLSPIRKREILTAELARLGEESSAIERVLAEMDEAVAA
jgi:hypothetical protein